MRALLPGLGPLSPGELGAEWGEEAEQEGVKERTETVGLLRVGGYCCRPRVAFPSLGLYPRSLGGRADRVLGAGP